jgi:hypothetical protein
VTKDRNERVSGDGTAFEKALRMHPTYDGFTECWIWVKCGEIGVSLDCCLLDFGTGSNKRPSIRKERHTYATDVALK